MGKYLPCLLATAFGALAVWLMLATDRVEPDDDIVAARLRTELETILTPQDLNDRTSRLLDSDRVEEAASFIALAQLLDRPLDAEVTARYDNATTTAATLLREGKHGVLGFLSGEADDAASLAGATISDFMIYGDIRDFTIQATNYVMSKEVDEWILGLSVVGLGMTAATVATGGASAPAKAGFSVVKAAKRTGKLTAGLEGAVRHTVLATADLPGLRKRLSAVDGRSPVKMLGEIKAHSAALDTQAMRTLLNRFGAIANRTSPADTLRIVRHVDSVDELARAERISARFGKATAATFDTLGKKVFKAFTTVALWAAAAFWALVTAIISFAMSALWVLVWILGFLLKRLFRRPALKAEMQT
jgi:hypothetical protein